MTSLLDVFEAAIRVKSTHPIKSCLKTRKRENMEIIKILHKSPSKRSFRHRIHNLLERADDVCRRKHGINCIFYINICCFSIFLPTSWRSISRPTVNQTFNYLVVNLVALMFEK